MILLIYAILIISAVLAVKRPLYCAVVYTFLVSYSSAYGIAMYLNSFFPLYQIAMTCILYCAIIVSLCKWKAREVDPIIRKYVYFSFVLCVLLSISVFVGVVFLKTGGSLLYRIVNSAIDTGPGVLIIALTDKQYPDKERKLIMWILIIELAISYIVIYLPFAGISMASVIDGSNFFPNGSIYAMKSNTATLQNFHFVFIKKGQLLRFAHFANQNDLGLFAGVLFSLSIERLMNKMYKKKLFYICLACLSFFMWCNSGTRSVMYAIILAILVVICKRLAKPTKVRARDALIFIILILFGLYFAISYDNSGSILPNYLFKSGAAHSMNTRVSLMSGGVDYLFSSVGSFMFGSGGDYIILDNIGVDVHLYPLRIATEYGILSGIVSLLLVFIFPIIDLIRARDISFYHALLLLNVILKLATNNQNILVWFMMAASVVIFCNKEKGEVTAVQPTPRCGNGAPYNVC